MKRTTIYLDPDLEVLLKAAMQRRRQPMAELVREAIKTYLKPAAVKRPPGAGAFASGRRDTAQRADTMLVRSRFGKPR
jgi:hypothetical protein